MKSAAACVCGCRCRNVYDPHVYCELYTCTCEQNVDDGADARLHCCVSAKYASETCGWVSCRLTSNGRCTLCLLSSAPPPLFPPPRTTVVF
jgi:hypothetical protein